MRAVNIFLAPSLYQQAAELHNAEAMGELALCHLLEFRGISTRYQDPSIALRWAKKGHLLQSALATFALALCFESGAGLACPDLSKAQELYAHAIARREPHALCRKANFSSSRATRPITKKSSLCCKRLPTRITRMPCVAWLVCLNMANMAKSP